MKRPAFISILLLFFAFSVYSKVWTLSDSNLEVRFDDQTSLLTVNDKRCNKVWQQSTSQNQFVVSKTVQNGHSLNVIFMGEYPMDVTFSLTPTSALEISLTADENMTFEELAFPSAFKTPDKSHFLLETDGEGLLLPVDDQNIRSETESPIFVGAVFQWPGWELLTINLKPVTWLFLKLLMMQRCEQKGKTDLSLFHRFGCLRWVNLATRVKLLTIFLIRVDTWHKPKLTVITFGKRTK